LIAALCAAQENPAPREAVEAEFTLEHADPSVAKTVGFHAGEDVVVRFSVRDKVSAAPLEGRHPEAWLDPRTPDETQHPVSCRERVRSLLGSGFLPRPTIDLNTYYVLVMNNDASITVMDPQFGSGDAQTVATIPLKAPAAGWAFSADGKLLFASMPETGELAVIDASNWRVRRDIEIGAHAGRVALQPDGHYLWVAYDDGIAAVDVDKLNVAAKIPTGAGPHDIALDAKGRFAFVTNRAAGSVSVIDIRRLAVVHTLHTGSPESVASSSMSGMAYVTDAESGAIAIIDPEKESVAGSISAEAGLGPIGFEKEGRFAVVLNPDRKLVHVLDASVNRLVQTGATPGHPDQVAFSNTVAYLRQRDGESVLMVPLEGLGAEGKPLPVADFPAGQHPLGENGAVNFGASIVQVPGENAAIVANAVDRSIYYYMEGMAAPIGYFSTRAREPLAVLVLDKGLKEVAKGVYQTTAHLKGPGAYEVAFLMDSPQAIKCWELTVEPDPSAAKSPSATLELQSMVDESAIRPGAAFNLRFRIIDAGGKTPRGGAKDVSVRIFRAPGVWHRRMVALPGEDGSYGATLTLPEAGVYYVNAESPSLGLSLTSEPIILHVGDR
jgi:hypothetical protein